MSGGRVVVSESYDTDISVSSRVSSEIDGFESEDDEDVANGKSHDSYINELEERKKYVQEFINKSFWHFKKGLDFGYTHDQDMSYYQEVYSYNDDRPMLGPVDDASLDAVSDALSDDGPDYDPDYDEEVNRLLDEVDKELLHDSSSLDADERNGVDYFDPKREQYEDYYDEFPEDMHHVGPIPSWYSKMLQQKIKETKKRLENLSSLVCCACATAGAHIKRIEQDHRTTFCKMDYPRHPPLDKPWTNFWKFNCMIKCKEINKTNHAHTADCESVLLEHHTTGVSTATKNICPNEYPKFVMDAVELFQDFAIETTKNVPFLDSKEATDTVYEKPVWTEMKLRSNYKNELQIVLRGKGVTSLISKLKRYYETGPGSTSNVISVYCINQKWSQKKSNFLPSFVAGILKIRDKLGPISINYEPKTSVIFNSVESIQLGKVIEDYAGLTKETTLLDVGCNFGVLSLMMSHRCDRVIGLNSMHCVNSELNQAEELKRNNGVHNVSFMGCDPKDVLSKCSSIVRRSICVAVLNLASPYGKSIHVMQALRDIPTIWRIIIYGSFTTDFHRNITILTSKDDTLGEHYLPMQGCILDKSPSVEDAFDVVILFERKSLITPSIELFAPGPTVNVKDDSDSYSYGSLEDSQNNKHIIKFERGFGKPDYRVKKFVNSKPFIKYRGPTNKFGKFDSPMLPMDKEQTPENLQKKSQEKSLSPTRPERKFDCSLLELKPPVVSPVAQNGKGKAVYPSIRKELHIKELKRIFDSPYLPLPKVENPPTNGKQSPFTPPKERKFDCSVLRQQKKFDCSMLRQEKKFDCSMLKQEKKFDCSMLKQEKKFDCSMLKQEKKFDCSTLKQEKKSDCSMLRNQEKLPQRLPLPYHSLPIKKEVQLSCPTPPREVLPSLPSPLSGTPTGNGFLEASQIKKEKDLDLPLMSNVEAVPMELCDDDKEEGELSPERDDESPIIPVKPKAFDPSYFIGFSDVNCENIAQPVTAKSEPGETVRIKEEPKDTLSSNPQDIQNMETPIHQPRALDSRYPSALTKSANFTNVDGHAFSVKSNQSFLSFNATKKEPKEKIDPDEDEEIEIIGEKKIVASAQHRIAETRIRVKSLDEIIKTKNEAEQNDDLRTLIEQRKTLQRKLDREREVRCYKDLHGLSPSPDFPRRYKREPSSSPPPFSRKYNRSPSPYSRRSPGDRRYKRSPPSPTRQRVKREQSPSPRAWIKRERSRSPGPRWVKRERSPRRWRRSPSPSEKRYRRSPSPVRYKKDPYSPVRFKRDSRSPVGSRWGEKIRRSPSSSSSHKSSNKWKTYKRAKSPDKPHEKRKRTSRSKSPAGGKRKCGSLSPINLSPSPPRKRDNAKDQKKKEIKESKEEKKKSKPTTKSKSPTREPKNKNKTLQDDSTWDIPVLSSLSPLPKNSDKLEESKSSDKIESSKALDKVDVSINSGKVEVSINSGKVDKSNSPDKVDEPKSSDKVDEPKSSDKVAEPKSSDKVDELRSSEKVEDPTSSKKVNEPQSLEKVDEPKSSEKVDEPKSSEKVDEPKSSDKVDEPKSSDIVDVSVNSGDVDNRKSPDKVDKSKSSDKVDKSKGLENVDEPTSSEIIDEPKSLAKADEPKSSEKVDEPKSSDKIDRSQALNKVDVSINSGKVEVPINSGKVDKSNSPDKVDEPKSSEKVEEPTSPKKVNEPQSLEKVDEPKSWDKVDEPKSSEKVDESKSSEQVGEPEIETECESSSWTFIRTLSDKVDESKSLDELDEPKSSEKVDKLKSSEKADEPKIETAQIERTASVNEECESKSKSSSFGQVIETVIESEVASE